MKVDDNVLVCVRVVELSEPYQKVRVRVPLFSV